MVYFKHQDKLIKLGEAINTARKLRSLTQDELAIRAGITRQSVSAIEKGAASKTETLISILFVLGLDQQFLDSITLENDDVGLRISRLQLPKIIKRKNGGDDDF
jgi:transcriptional regulator with XRE-family HTH domain